MGVCMRMRGLFVPIVCVLEVFWQGWLRHGSNSIKLQLTNSGREGVWSGFYVHELLLTTSRGWSHGKDSFRHSATRRSRSTRSAFSGRGNWVRGAFSSTAMERCRRHAPKRGSVTILCLEVETEGIDQKFLHLGLGNARKLFEIFVLKLHLLMVHFAHFC